MLLSFRSAINVVEHFKSIHFEALCNDSLVVGTGGIGDAENIREGRKKHKGHFKNKHVKHPRNVNVNVKIEWSI